MSPEPDLFGGFRMSGAGGDNPGNATVRVRAVPDPASGGDLVLPLFEDAAGYFAVDELPTELLLTGGVVRDGGSFGEDYPGFPGIRSGAPAEFFPALGRFRRSETRFPTARTARWGHSVAAFRSHDSVSGRVGNRPEVGVERLGELLGQLVIGVDGSGGLPLADRLRERRPLPNLG